MGAWIETADWLQLYCRESVAPYVGAWIETMLLLRIKSKTAVAPYVGAWIETLMPSIHLHHAMSHPTWVRGLKQSAFGKATIRRTVAPYVGAWIETFGVARARAPVRVAPYVGAWIETLYAGLTSDCEWSHPTWVRGLKHLCLR